MTIINERTQFLMAKQSWSEHARQTAALSLLCGINLEKALTSSPKDRERLVTRLRRYLERERLRGAQRHWCYDLNRHIALKQAMDRLVASTGAGKRDIH
ncbi:cytoplasmic protein [Tianweitania sediminis]|uniref:Cytoplasmic protein n=1 Tax=Tianweitania sediminis TaxID=1502156 RepID=A0A8J7QY65_9HYPH|nr:cytoplasmic protein [Tianweitania sediminis]MBP0438878.1 cytoplasmic protein [Tianweitania sediminis]